MAGVALFTIASIAAALSTTSAALIVARAVQGLGAAAIMPLSLTLLASAVPPRMRSAAIGNWGGISGLGIALRPVVGGAAVQGISWQAISWINVPVAVVAIPLMLVAVTESRGVAKRLDLLGTLLIGGAVLLGIWGIVHGNDDGWGSATVVGCLVAATLLVPAYVLLARRREHAILPLRLFASRGFASANVIALFFNLGMFGAVFLLSQYLQIVQGYTPFGAGLRTLPWTSAPMVVAPLAGLIAPRVGLRSLLLTGLALQTGSLVWLASVTGAGGSYAAFAPALLMAGVGMGMTFPTNATATLDGLPESDFAMASSANPTIREFGVAFLAALFAPGRVRRVVGQVPGGVPTIRRATSTSHAGSMLGP